MSGIRASLGSTRFLRSYPSYASLPLDNGLEVAFAGRSNTGKSSVLNALCGRRILAKISSTPGKTRHINFFESDGNFRLADLPGYGYARLSASERRRWGRELSRYVTERECLLGLIIVMDIRHPLMETDKEMLALCRIAERRAHVLLNKSDKLNFSRRYASLEQVGKSLGSLFPGVSCGCFSAFKGDGIAELRRVLDDWVRIVGAG